MGAALCALLLFACAAAVRAPLAGAASPRATAADVDYGPLRRVGVSAGSAIVEGRILTIRISLKRRTELRLAIVDGDRIQAFAKATLKAGRYRFSGRLRGVPRASTKPQLRVTARLVGTRKRGRERRRISFKSTPAVNRPPTDIRLAPASVAENAAAGTLVGAFSVVDPDAGQAHAFTLVPGAGSTDNALFAVSAGSLVTVAPIDFEAKPTATVRVRATDSSGAPFERALTIAIANVNEAPTSLALSKADVDENQPAGATVGSLSSTDPEILDTPTFSLVAGTGDADNALFAVEGTLLKTAALLDFEAAPTRSIRLRVSDGHGGTFDQQFTITVNGLNELPTGLALSSATVAENEPAATTIGTLSASDQDTADTLTFTLVTGAGDTDNALFAISGSTLRTAAVLDFEQQATRSVRVRVSDGKGGTAELPFTITVTNSQDPPELTATGAALDYTENDPATVVDPGLTVGDDDDTNLEGATVAIVTGFEPEDELLFSTQNGITGSYDTGTGVLTLTGTSSLANYQLALRSVQFRTTGDNPATGKSARFVAGDGDDDSLPVTRAITVTRVNDAPVNTVPGAQTVNEDATLTFSTGSGNALSVSDVDAAAAQVTLGVTTGRLSLSSTAGLAFLAGDGTADASMTFTGSLANVNAALNGLQYLGAPDDTGAETITLTTSDQGSSGSGGTLTDTDTVAVTINAVNNAPVNTVPGAQAVDEDTTLTFSTGNGNAVSVADIDAGASPLQVTLDVDHGTLTLLGPAGLAFSAGDGTADATMTFSGSQAAINTALDNLKYLGASDYNGPETLTITTSDQGNTGSGGALQDQDGVAITVNPVNDPPQADNETIGGAGQLNDQAIGNTTFQVDDPSDNKSAPTNPHTEITGDILDGDTDPDGPGPLIVQSAGSDAGATNGQTADGGTVSIESDGDFVYQPPASVSCDNGTDSFNYKISDQQSSGAGPIPGTAIGTVTIHLEGCVWYVSNSAAGNAGTAAQPFDTLAQAETASGANHTVFVFDGDNTSTGYQTGYALNSGERLIGEHEGLTVDADGGGPMTADSLHPANPGAHPTLAATNEDVVDLDDGNEVRGFNLDPAGAGSGIAGSLNDTGGGTIDDVNIVDTAVAGAQPGLDLTQTAGTYNISNLVVNNTAAVSPPNTATGVRLDRAGTVVFNPTGQISITTNGAAGLDVDGIAGTPVALGTSTFDAITVTNSSAGGVSLTQTSGTINLGDGTGTDLNLTTTSGATPAFALNNAGSGVSVAEAGTDDVHATGGPAVDVTATTNPTLDFDDADSTNSANDGINLDGLGTGTFTADTGNIGGADGISFDVNGGSGTITYAGALDNGDGTTAIEITGRGGGTATLSGPIADTNDAGGSIVLGGAGGANTGGTISFSGAAKKVETTGATAGVTSSGTGATINFTGGGLDIDTQSGIGFHATGGGTITVQGSGNTIFANGSGTALSVANTTIGASGLTFQSIAAGTGSGSAGNGIVLDTTGASGGLTVTGTGTAGSGGTIQHKTGADGSTTSGIGIYLNSTTNPSFAWMQLNDFDNYAIRGLGVVGFSLANSVINATGAGKNGTNVGVDEGSISFGSRPPSGVTGLTGIASVTNTTIEDGVEDSFSVFNVSGTLNLTMDNISVSGSGNDGVLNQNYGTATGNIEVKNSDFSANVGDHFNATADGSANLNAQFGNNGANTLTGGAAGALGQSIVIQTGVAWAGTGSANVSNNSINNAVDTPINVNIGGTGTFLATVSNNTIGTSGVVGSGTTANEDAIRIIANGDASVDPTPNGGTLTAAVTNNTIQQVSGRGIYSLARDGGTAGDPIALNLTITGNLLRQSPSSGGQGIRVEGGATSTDDVRVHANIGGAGGLANVFQDDWGTNEPAGIDFDEIRITHNFSGISQFILTDLGANTSSTATVASYLAGRNTLPGGGAGATSATLAGGGVYETGGVPPVP